MRCTHIMLFLLCSGSALGNGVLRWGFGAEDLGAAGAFGLSRGNPITAVQSNPALLAEAKNEFAASGRLLLGDAEFRRGGSTSHLTDDIGAYPDIALTWKTPHPDITWGIGISPVSALEAKWRFEDVPGGIGGISYGENLGHQSRYTAIKLATGIGWQINDAWSLGLSAGAIRSEVVFRAPFIFQTNPALANAKVDLDLETDDWAPTFSLGLHYRPHDDWQIGFNITPSVSFDHRGDADADFSAQLPGLSDPLASYDARARNELPLTIGLGTSWQANERLSLALRADWHQWSKSYDSLRINLSDGSNAEINSAIGGDSPSDEVPVKWSDRLVVAIGAEYELTDSWTLRGGWRYGKSPVPDEFVTPLNSAILEQALTIGLGWQTDDWQLDFAWAYEFGSSVSVGTSGYNAGEYSNSSVDLDAHYLSLSVQRTF